MIKLSTIVSQVLVEDEQLSPSFENAIVLWTLKEIDPRLALKVKNYGHKMTGNVTLKDLQPVIFQNISMLEDLDEVVSNRALASLSIDSDREHRPQLQR
jgi:hypothetical protein